MSNRLDNGINLYQGSDGLVFLFVCDIFTPYAGIAGTMLQPLYTKFNKELIQWRRKCCISTW